MAFSFTWSRSGAGVPRTAGAALLGVLLGAPFAAAAPPAPVEIANAFVKARFAPGTDGTVAQEYYARTGDGWRLVATAFRAPQPFPPQGNRQFDAGVDPQRWFVHDALATAGAEPGNDKEQLVRLRGTARGATIEQTVTLRPGERLFHVEVTAHIPGVPPRLDCLVSTFAFEIGRAHV